MTSLHGDGRCSFAPSLAAWLSVNIGDVRQFRLTELQPEIRCATRDRFEGVDEARMPGVDAVAAEHVDHGLVTLAPLADGQQKIPMSKTGE
jgi:hypothetical protein